MTAPVNHPENGTNLRYGGQQADGDITAALIKALQDLRCPDADRTKCVGQAEIRQGKINLPGNSDTSTLFQTPLSTSGIRILVARKFLR